MENKINDVDEIFESFVKKKLQQLGIKRTVSKSLVDTSSTQLENDVKMRLERCLQCNDENPAEDTSASINPPIKWKEISMKKKSKKKKDKDKEKKKKDKSESSSKKKKKREKEKQQNYPDVDNCDNYRAVSNASSMPDIGQYCTSDNKMNICMHNELSEEIGNCAKSNLTNENGKSMNEEGKKMKSSLENSTFGPVLPPRKDISIIKMKIEMLRAKCVTEQQKKNDIERGNSCSRIEERSQEKSRSRSPRHGKYRSHRRSRSSSRSRHRKSSHHQSRSPRRHVSGRRHRRRSSSPTRKRRKSSNSLISPEDKVRLLEIAKANALAQHKVNYVANSMSGVGKMIKNSSMSVHQLTKMCKEISTGPENSSIDAPLSKDEAEKLLEKAAGAEQIHHPFSVRDMPIAIKIRSSLNAPPPVILKPAAELSKEFPVSCGQQHRRKEVLETVYGKWEAVAKDEATKSAVKELVTSDKVFVDSDPVDMDLSTVISERISAARQLQENPKDPEANAKLMSVQQKLDNWTKSKQVIGQFTGDTGLQPMSKQQLEGGRQAWFRQEDFLNAKHVGGIGKSLLQKMGWTPGTPLGKTMPGQLEPLTVNLKTDRRGLSSFMEESASPKAKKFKAGSVASGPTVKDLSSKHPVSALMEICSKRKWPAPQFTLVNPENAKSFTFKVNVQNDEYIGKPANTKKQAKFLAASVTLQCMGLIPKTVDCI